MVSLMRIDDRLIHGQVAYVWATSLVINGILGANAEAKNDQMKAMSLNLAKPSNVTLYIMGVEESGELVDKYTSSKKSNVL
ncbi:PTS sugar transporter subunit IIB, partial [Clostridioides difficile]|uniref:PTS sugar transporter subunit IIB n=1 Tax=Clostridioides difficile TaxID=1496 RepID=UPI0031B5C60D